MLRLRQRQRGPHHPVAMPYPSNATTYGLRSATDRDGCVETEVAVHATSATFATPRRRQHFHC
jgi:hypothetical protein